MTSDLDIWHVGQTDLGNTGARVYLASRGGGGKEFYGGT